jgi:CRP-like cAMP-binding protein
MTDAGALKGRAWPRNRLLRLLPEEEKARLLSIAETIELRPRQVLHHWRLPMDNVYFVETGLVSVSAKVGANRFVAAWLIGSEGMIGATLVLAEDDRKPPHRRVVQVGGSAILVPAQQFLSMLPETPVLRSVILRYVSVVLSQTSQSGACNSVHPLRQRLARWLLVASNALESPDVLLTHEVLAELLGVRRASVTECLEVLEEEGCIANSRGVIHIRDAATLRGTSCKCFEFIEREELRLMNKAGQLTR